MQFESEKCNEVSIFLEHEISLYGRKDFEAIAINGVCVFTCVALEVCEM